MRHLLRLGLLLLSLYALNTQAQLRLVLAEDGLNAAQVRASTQLLTRAAQALPESFKERLDQRVSISWSDTLPVQVMGRLRSLTRIELNARHLDDLVDGRARAPTKRTHQSLEQELLATLIHELAHLYDRRFTPSAAVRGCQSVAKRLGPQGLPEHCYGQLQRRFVISDEPRFLDLAGWARRIGSQGARGANFYTQRSPDPYELASSREFFAVNFEYFVLDPSYACRRPLLDAYLREHFTLPQPPACAPLPYVNAAIDKRYQGLGALDPARVYAVDYLLAEPNQNFASRFGHSMLRLVVCAPERAVGPDCRLDISHHLVLSYRAFVDDLQLSSWQGLTGGYPSRLFILPLAQVIDEYTKVELRALSSIPLAFSQAQVQALVKQAVQAHWSYDGQYYFVSNNCAVETLNLLRIGTMHPALANLQSISPTSLLTLFKARGLADTQVLDDLASARRQGYWFDSYRERYTLMLKVLNRELGVPQKNVEDWLNQSAKARSRWFAKANTQALAALLLLEQAALRRELLLAQHEFKVRYLSDAQQAAGTVSELIAASGFLSRPADALPSGYGIAQPVETAPLTGVVDAQYQHLLSLDQQLQSQLQNLLSQDRLATLEAVQSNLKSLGHALRKRSQLRLN